jgi:predicted amidohydrolase
MKLALFQERLTIDVVANEQKALSAIAQAAGEKADMIVFPELQTSLFFPQYSGLDVRDRSFALDSPFIQELCESCRAHRIMAVPNVYLYENGHYFDASILIDKTGRILGIQKMVHIAQAQQFYEQDYYTPSDDGFHVFETEFGKIGIVVCFDRHYPESIRTEALLGADLIIIPTANTREEDLEMFEWELRVQAFHSSTAIAMCNRTGKEDQMDFAGESIVVDANGKTLAKANADEQLLYCDIAPEQSAHIRSSRPYTSLRRPDCYL